MVPVKHTPTGMRIETFPFFRTCTMLFISVGWVTTTCIVFIHVNIIVQTVWHSGCSFSCFFQPTHPSTKATSGQVTVQSQWVINHSDKSCTPTLSSNDCSAFEFNPWNLPLNGYGYFCDVSVFSGSRVNDISFSPHDTVVVVDLLPTFDS